MKLYVGNFSFDTTERSLRELFEPFGTVTEVKLITDRETGEPRGFGFVTMGNVAEGNAAIKGLILASGGEPVALRPRAASPGRR